MSSVTMELRQFFENGSHLNNYKNLFPSHAEKIERGRPVLFDFSYPIFDEGYRHVFETHFIRNFYMREIGMETFGLFKFHLETWLNINMPYYNKLFESELLEFNPLENFKVTTSHNRKNNESQDENIDTTKDTTANTKDTVHSESTGETTSDNDSITDANKSENTDKTSHLTGNEKTDGTTGGFSREIESNNPDSRLELTSNDGVGVIEYASGIKEHKSSGDNSSNTDRNEDGNSNQKTDVDTHSETHENSKINSTSSNDGNSNRDYTDNETSNSIRKNDITKLEDYLETKVGKIGSESYSKMMKEYRSILLRIEKQIFNEMNELFMLVYHM